MKQRCYNINNPKYYLYGGKNITICDEWLNDYNTFKKWALENGYKPNSKLSIDRIDSSKDYCPENCRWISISENSARANIGRHKYKSKKGSMYAVTPEGKQMLITNVTNFCKQYNFNRCLVSHRLNNIIKNPYLNGWKFFRIQQQKV